MNDKIIETIKKYEKKGDFNYAKVTEEMIIQAEEKLKVKIPEQYVSYLKRYGHGGIAGIEILGIGLTGRLIFVDSTLEYREEGLPENLIVIENVDEYVTCIDCNTEKVVSWDYSGYIKEDYQSFDDYLIDQMDSAIENL